MDKFFQESLKQSGVLFAPSVVLEGEQFPQSAYQTEFSKDGSYMRIFVENGFVVDDIYVKKLATGVQVRRTVKNVSGRALKIKELSATFDGIDFCGAQKDDYFYSVENPRIYEAFTFPIDYKRTEADASNSEFDVQANNRWADPGVVCDRINRSPYQPFPAILLGNYKKTCGLLHGSLSQAVCYHNYLVSHSNAGIKLEIFSSFKDLAYLEVKNGRVIVDEWYMGYTDHADDFNRIFENYVNVLRTKLPANYGASEINRTSLIWGSWNDGIFRDVTHDILLAEAKALKEKFPTVKWFQLDDGYAVFNKQENSNMAHGLGMPYENDGVDYEKFPRGLKAYTDEIKKIGLRPSIWIGGLCPKASKIYRERPEWFSTYERLSSSQPLDVSIPSVREYMTDAVDTLIVDYGFEGVKHDFWSYPFEDSGDLYSSKDKSGYEYRTWWLQELRKRLPKDGYLQTGCDIVLGNPFLGEYFTNYRYGIDVGSGKWDHVKTTMLWGITCFGTHTGDLFVPNSDAIGLLEGLNDTDFIFWINYVWITHSMVELSGRYSKEDINQKRFKILQKATCNINNGQDVYFSQFDYRKKGRVIPEIMYIKTPTFSVESEKEFMPVRTVALFNVSEETKSFEINAAELGLSADEYVYTDVWSFEQEQNSVLRVTLKAHESRMFAVNKKQEYSIFDANCKISNAVQNANAIDFEAGAVETAEILVSKKVSSVKVNGKQTPFEYADGVVKFALKEGGNVSLVF